MAVERKTAERGDSVKSARRALEILELLTERAAALSFSEIAAELQYPRSSLHGLLATMTDSGWLRFAPGTRQYTLGIRVWEAGNAYAANADLAARARQYMTDVRGALNETVQLAVLDGRYNIYIAKVDSDQRLVLDSAIGKRLEAHATGLGKVLLAGLTDAEVERRLGGATLERFTEHTITDYARLRAELEDIRREGYGYDSEEYTVGVRCVAAPVRDHTGHVIAAMSVSVPTIRFDQKTRERATDLLVSAVGELSAALGYTGEGVGPTPEGS